MKEIFCRIDRCLACKSCEIACAVVHSESGELVAALQESPLSNHRVRVLKVDDNGGKVRLRSVALQCRQCLEPACVDACIAGGIVKDETTGVVRFDRERCVGCWSCTMVCPFGAIIRVQDAKVAIKCDRCEDREQPACVVTCPTGALIFCEPEEFEALMAESDLILLKESK
jgi:carbon-monoxide dehydrogenase iron sulfur subunit